MRIAWSLAIVGCAVLAHGGSVEPTDGQDKLSSSLAAFRGTVPAPVALAKEETTAPPDAETTAPPDAATTTPAPPETAEGILAGMQRALHKQLYQSVHQWVSALLAFIFGIVMLIDGERCFKGLVIAAAFLLAAVLAMSEVSDLWQLGENSKIRLLVGLEVGAFGAYAALLGLDGVLVIVGAILGSCVAFATQGQLVSLGATALSTNKLIIVILYSLFSAGAIVIFKKKKHVKGVAVLSAVVGGALVSSAVSWFTTDLAVLGHASALCSRFDLTPVGGAWIEFFLLLWSSSASDKGWFAHSTHNFEISNQTYRLDRVLGCSVWLVLSVVGAVRQLRAIKTRVADARGLGADSLQETLLTVKE